MKNRLLSGDQAPAATFLNAKGEPVALQDIWATGPTLLIFLRHFGCIFCREWMSELEQRSADIQAAGLQLVVVALGEPKHAARYGPKLIPSATTLASPTNEPYHAYGFGQGDVRQLVGPQTLVSGVRATLKGHMQGVATGDVKMLGGTIVVDRQGRVRYTHYSEFAGDNPNLDELLATQAVAEKAEASLSPA